MTGEPKRVIVRISNVVAYIFISTTDTVAYSLVGGVVDVCRGLLHQEGGELKQEDPHGVWRPKRVVGVDDTVDEDTDDVVVAVLVGGWHAPYQSLTLPLLKGVRKARDEDVLKNLWIDK